MAGCSVAGAPDAFAAAPVSDALGAADDDGCGNAYSANTAGRLATSLSVVAVDANSNRCGGNVGAPVGTAGEPLGPGLVSAPETFVETVGVAPGELDAPGLAEPLGLAPGSAATVRVTAGGGVETVSSSATARR